MTAKIYRVFLSLLLLFVASKVVSFALPEEVMLAEEAKSVTRQTTPSSSETYLISDVPSSHKVQLSTEEEVVEDDASIEEIAIVDEVPVEDNVDSLVVEESEIEVVQNQEQHQEAVYEPIQPMTIYLSNIAIKYENGGMVHGQSVIDQDYNMASTWGGAEVYSGDDGLSTHFIGHNPGIFSELFNVYNGSEISVTDYNGTLTTYTVQLIWVVDNSGYDVNTGADTWDLITGSGNGEAISLQTCVDDYTNLIIFATQ